jgi:hypothetical protein
VKDFIEIIYYAWSKTWLSLVLNLVFSVMAFWLTGIVWLLVTLYVYANLGIYFYGRLQGWK